MSKAIGYTRISTKDQSNFSLSFQAEQITGYCSQNNIELLKIYEDKGQSAKNFDRVNWRELERYLQENYKQVNLLIVAKYDRFSRNVVDSLQMIEKLEKRYDVRIVSVMENIGLHPQSPYFFKFRTDLLTGAQMEWLIIKERTKIGINRAKREGRTVNSAPIGYKNSRDERNLPIIIIDEAKAPMIKLIYHYYIQGIGATEIFKRLKKDGYFLNSRTNVMKILANPTYAGLVRVPALYDQPEQLVKGLHDSIIPENTWWQVQALLNDRPKKHKVKLDERFPLRGFLTYVNGKHFTSYHAQGKNKKVPYYRVFSPDKSFNANKLHDQMAELLKTLNLLPRQVEYLRSGTLRELEVLNADNNRLVDKRRNELQQYLLKLSNINEDRAERIMDAETYSRLHYQYSLQVKSLEEDLCQLERPGAEVMERYDRIFHLLTDLHAVYEIAEVPEKHGILKMVFDKGLSHDGTIYRTPEIFEVYEAKAALLKEKRLLEIEQPLVNLSESGSLYRVRESNP